MHRLVRHRPSPAMVVACVALLVALGGTSIAAVNALAPNSVGPVQLRTGAVTNPKLRNNAVTGPKVQNHSSRRQTSSHGRCPRARPARRALPVQPGPPV